MLATLSAFEGFLYLITKEPKDPSLPSERPPESNGILPIARLDARELTPKTLRSYLAYSRPVILTHFRSDLLAQVPTAVAPRAPGLPEERLLIDVKMMPRLGPLSRWMLRYVGRPAIYMARFTGSYKAGVCHMDSLPSYNFYYVHRGRKRVIIVPRQYADRLNLRGGYDSVYVDDDRDDLDHLSWLDVLPGYYDFELAEGEVLLFHNTACPHKFANLTPEPEIYTIRLLSLDASKRVLANDVLNWEGAKFFTQTLFERTSVRDTYSV